MVRAGSGMDCARATTSAAMVAVGVSPDSIVGGAAGVLAADVVAVTAVVCCAVAAGDATSVGAGGAGSGPQLTASRPATDAVAISKGAIERLSMVSTLVSQKAARVVRILRCCPTSPYRPSHVESITLFLSMRLAGIQEERSAILRASIRHSRARGNPQVGNHGSPYWTPAPRFHGDKLRGSDETAAN